MTPFKKIFGPLSTLLFLGALLTLLLTILTGSVTKSIYKDFYWLETDCSGFSGAEIDGNCRWTNYGICGVSNGDNDNCSSNSAAFPLDPARNFGSGDGLPSDFQHNNNYYYYTSRIGYGFQLAGVGLLFLAFLAFFAFWFMDKIAWQSIFWVLLTLATLFIIPGAALTTTAYVKGRNIFRSAGLHTKIGVKSMALLWTTVALVLLLWLFSILMNKSTDSFKFKGTGSGGWYKRKDIPPQNQIVGVNEQRYDGSEFTATNPHTIGASTTETKITTGPPPRDTIV